MFYNLAKRVVLYLGGFFLLWFSARYILPILMPFLAGALLALAAEPLVSFGQRRLRLPRAAATGLGVGVVLGLLLCLLWVLGTLLIRELLHLANSMPDLGKTTKQGIQILEHWAVDLTYQAPDGLRPVLTRTVENTFSDSSIFLDQAAEKVTTWITGILSGVPDSALGVGTTVLAAFMISARLPRFRAWKDRLPPVWQEQYLPAFGRAKAAMTGWLRAQGLLLLMIFAIVAVGFLLLRIPYGIFWALLIALLDAVPMLGTGLVLLPWSLVCFLMGNTAQGVGILGIFATASLSRSIVEPKLLGKHLGLDALLTLVSLYGGYRILGFWGLLIAPICTAAVKSAWCSKS